MRKQLAHLSDEALVALMARGDETALGELYDRVGRIAYGLAVRILRDDRLAEDAVQEGFLSAWRTAASFRAERAKASTWILTLVHRRAVDLVRREERRRAEPPVVVPIETARRRRLTPVLGVAAAVAAVVAIALGIWAAHLSSELDKTRSALDGQRSAAALLADPAARKVSLSSGDGKLVVDDSGRAALVLDGLEAAPSGKTYETWIIAGGNATPAGTFPGGNRVDVVGVHGVVKPGDVVAVTVERDGGASKPTTTPIVSSTPV